MLYHLGQKKKKLASALLHSRLKVTKIFVPYKYLALETQTLFEYTKANVAYVSMKHLCGLQIMVSCAVTPCSLVGASTSYSAGEGSLFQPPTTLHGITAQKSTV
jgi:hypothetical protein